MATLPVNQQRCCLTLRVIAALGERDKGITNWTQATWGIQQSMAILASVSRLGNRLLI